MKLLAEEKPGKTNTDPDIPGIFSFSAGSIPVVWRTQNFSPPNPSSHRLAALPKLSMGQASSLIGQKNSQSAATADGICQRGFVTSVFFMNGLYRYDFEFKGISTIFNFCL
jgi:hypothetical protein